MNWSSPEEANLARLKNIKKELEELIKNIEENEAHNVSEDFEKQSPVINNELLSKSKLKHKTRTTQKINIGNASISDSIKNEHKTTL